MKDAARKLNMSYHLLQHKWRRHYDHGHWPGMSAGLFKLPVMGSQKHEFVKIKAAEDSMAAKRVRASAARAARQQRHAYYRQVLLDHPYNQPIKQQLLELLVPDKGNAYHVSPPASRLLVCPILVC